MGGENIGDEVTFAQVQTACEAPLAEGAPIESGNAHALAAKRRG